jgi:hypothetical protein
MAASGGAGLKVGQDRRRTLAKHLAGRRYSRGHVAVTHQPTVSNPCCGRTPGGRLLDMPEPAEGALAGSRDHCEELGDLITFAPRSLATRRFALRHSV